MGANAQTTVPTFTVAQVLTADQMNQSARTGVPVFANTTDRDAAFGGAGEKTLAEGQLCYVENLTGVAQIQYYDGAAWVSLGSGGLAFISATTIGTGVSSVTVSNAFSATYDAYKITITGGVGSSTNAQLYLTFGATASSYKWAYVISTASPSGQISAAGTYIPVGEINTNIIQMNTEVFNPFLAKHTYVNGTLGYNNSNDNGRLGVTGLLQDTTSYTAFTLTPSTGTLTGGTIRVYGYANS